MLSKDTPSFELGGPSTIALPEVGAAAAAAGPTGPAWVQSTPVHQGMSTGAMTDSLIESVMAVMAKELGEASLEGKEEKVKAALTKAMKFKVNALYNHGYAMGHTTVMEEAGPPRQANNPAATGTRYESSYP